LECGAFPPLLFFAFRESKRNQNKSGVTSPQSKRETGKTKAAEKRRSPKENRNTAESHVPRSAARF
jgi:hypothetical protein